jgi:hypothetical protein
MSKGFLYCAVVLILAMRGIAPATAQFPPLDKGGRCPDGTITVARAGNDLALFWFGSIDANTIVAYGTLTKR